MSRRRYFYQSIVFTILFSLIALPAAAKHKSFEARSIDGSGNNLSHADYGSTEIPLLRKPKADYADNISAPAGATRKSAREISNIVAEQLSSTPNKKDVSDFVWQWGQFLDHDIDLSPDASGEAFNISVPTGDQYFDPASTGTAIIPMHRTIYTGGTSHLNPRQQMNVITAFIDASNVYGSDDARAFELRTFQGGKLKTSAGNLLPFNVNGFPNAGGPDPALFLGGDIRANEQAGLTAMHTLFVREHNRLCNKAAAKHPQWSDEKIYQYARKIVGAQMQVISYKEFLPLLLGKDAIKSYNGYKKGTNPGISNEFSTGAYRFGHSMLSEHLLRLDDDNEVIIQLALKDAFFNPLLMSINGGIDSIFRGLAQQKAQEIDNQLIDAVRNFLFGPPGSGGFDLASLNIQRGRDHGLADYNTVRKAYGLKKVTRYRQITKNKSMRKKLRQAYPDINNMDLWVAGLAEDHVDGAMVGKTFHKILVDQFTRLRDGDRFWYQNDPFFKKHEKLLKDVKNTKLSDIIKRNTDVDDELPNNVFK